jgi:hypothetical protein
LNPAFYSLIMSIAPTVEHLLNDRFSIPLQDKRRVNRGRKRTAVSGWL